MHIIGLRAEPNAFNWAIATGTLEVPQLVATDRVQIAVSRSFADGANFLRLRLMQLLCQYGVTIAGVRTPESALRGAPDSLRKRLRIEGVLLATCSEAGVHVTQGPLATLSSLLGVKSAKTLLESADYSGINWSDYSKEKREAILMSVSLLKGEQ